MKKTLLSFLCLALSTAVLAQTAAVKQYYSAANKEKGAQLKTALYKIINKHTQRSYKQLWSDFSSTDRRADGKVWDMYSNKTNYEMQGSAQGAQYSKEGDAYNREHSFPKSWFNDGYPMYTDLFHLYPVDGYINGRRSNFPFGETDGNIYKSSGDFSKLGACKTPGYTGTVFEPNDEYKGDLARTYFYMVTAYEAQIPNWKGADGAKATLDGKTYPGLSSWQLQMLLRWAKEDTVSTKERERNNAVYAIQKNRNPFIDYPGLEVYVWGDSTAVNVDLLAYTNPYSGKMDTTPIDSSLINPKDTITVIPTPGDSTSNGSAGLSDSYVLVTSATDLVEGKHYIIANPTYSRVIGSNQGSYFNYVEAMVDANGVTFSNDPDEVTVLTLRKNGSNYAFEVSTNKYLGYGTRNSLTIDSVNTGEAIQWQVVFSADGTHSIQHVPTSRLIRYNHSSPRFSTYLSGQLPALLYVENASVTGIGTVLRLQEVERKNATGLYDLSGRRTNAKRGIVIRNGQKEMLK